MRGITQPLDCVMQLRFIRVFRRNYVDNDNSSVGTKYSEHFIQCTLRIGKMVHGQPSDHPVKLRLLEG
jgi:hypothetical protein